jgi:hypothetical protein
VRPARARPASRPPSRVAGSGQPDGGVATVEGTVTDEGVAAPGAPAGGTAGAPAAGDRVATGRGGEVVTAAEAAVDDALGAGEDTYTSPPADNVAATDQGD